MDKQGHRCSLAFIGGSVLPMNTKLISGLVIWAALSLPYAPALQADWSFVMMGDTKGDRDKTKTGVSEELPIIAQKIASLNPSLVLVCGDLINGDDVPDTNLTYAVQYADWKTAMSPVFNYTGNTGIPIYPVRGNHDNNSSEGPPIDGIKQAYYDAFSAYVPANGPNYGLTNNQVGFSYSFTTNNVTFVAADLYFYYHTNGYHELDQSWVTRKLQESSSPYKVFMAHEPFFQTEGTGEGEHFFGDSASAFTTRSNFWNELGTNGVQLYLTGHVHNETVSSITNDYGNNIIQLIQGNGGAPMDGVGNNPEAGVNVLYTNGSYGFSLATVSDTNMTIQYYSLNTNDNSWTVADYITSISPNQLVPEASTTLLLAPASAVWMAGRFLKRRRRGSLN